jgi:hypothetical protein
MIFCENSEQQWALAKKKARAETTAIHIVDFFIFLKQIGRGRW